MEAFGINAAVTNKLDSHEQQLNSPIIDNLNLITPQSSHNVTPTEIEVHYLYILNE